jgi:hypothetical protein
VREASQDLQIVKLGVSQTLEFTANLFATFGGAGHQGDSARRTCAQRDSGPNRDIHDRLWFITIE